MKKKNIAILGSTGSIGTQALEVIDQHTDKFEVTVLTANNNTDLLVSQALKYQPDAVVIANEEKYKTVSDALTNEPIKVFAGLKAIEQVVQFENIDTVITAMVGYAGLLPTISAIKARKRIALANKETLVVAGGLIGQLAQQYKSEIIPVDSEHSAIFQCLVGETQNPIEKIYLTASGGPFRGYTRAQLAKVTKAQALKHPNWEMGAKITIDSASLMNKGLEAIEAMWLFSLRPDQVDVIVHPQSIVHSIVQFQDGSMKAQMGLPDMKLPIQYAMAYPQRIASNFERFQFLDYPQLSFEKPDTENFKNLGLAFEAMHKGGNMPCIMNAANEIAVDAFLKDKIGFLEMSDKIEKAMQTVTFLAEPSLNELIATDTESREYLRSILQ